MQGKIHIGADVFDVRLPVLTAGQKCFVITDSNVYALYSAFLEKYFSGAEIFVLEAGEEHKNFHSLFAILEKMTGAGMRRTSRVFAVGGGVTGDIAGLAAALYMRGVSYVQIPTTLLAQVDSSVGGKTAVDLGGVKNVVGAFYQPTEVLISPEFLCTLPAREIKCGLGEIVKYAALNGEIFDALEQNPAHYHDLDFLTTLIVACVRHKARVVERDEKEQGERRSLNVGHTTGHAIELSYGLSHGESVLHGMRLETQMAVENGVCQAEYGARLLKIIDDALAVHPCGAHDFSHIAADAELAKSDKKNGEDGCVTMSVAKAKGEWSILHMPFEDYRHALETLTKKEVKK